MIPVFSLSTFLLGLVAVGVLIKGACQKKVVRRSFDKVVTKVMRDKQRSRYFYRLRQERKKMLQKLAEQSKKED